jgi:4a-hydroxytetrahydrobiopterin dehydratase
MSEIDLLEQHCVEYPSGSPPLQPDEVERYLEKVPGWKLEDGVVRRALRFPDFRTLIAFVNRLADAAEEEQHHPDFLVYGYRRMRIDFATHSIGGLSLNDFIMAARVSKLLETEPAEEADR